MAPHLVIDPQQLSPILPPKNLPRQWHLFDFTANNTRLAQVDLQDREAFERYINETMAAAGAEGGMGGYLEPRVLYQRSAHFDGEEEARSLHLGVDLWLPAYTPLLAPLAGTLHSYADNAGFGNYGPTLILEHTQNDSTFYTLYGHLAQTDMAHWKVGKAYAAGDPIATLGDYHENGDWPPHLHFQVMTDMLGNEGDFPGVAKPSEKEYWRTICPDPNLVLNFDILR